MVGDNRRVRNFEQSDYGNDRVPWGKTATASWIADRNRLDYAGQFIWTGVDYIGEPTPWHNQNDTPVQEFLFWDCGTQQGFLKMTIISIKSVVGARSASYGSLSAPLELGNPQELSTSCG